MKGFKVYITLIAAIFIPAISPGAVAQSLTSTLHRGQLACLGSEVIFTCVTRGSDTIAWTSNTYIGSGQLGFVAASSGPGDIRTRASNLNTVATLTMEYEDQGMIILESTLRIITVPDPQNTSVTCIHVSSGERRTAYFQVIGEPNKAEDIVAVQIEHTDDNCVVHTLWRSQNDGDTQYEVLANGMPMCNDPVTVNTVNGTRISALFPIRCDAYEISVNTSNVCGWVSPTSNYTLMQEPSHSLSDLISYRTNPPNVVTTGDATAENLAAMNDTLLGAVIGLAVVLGISLILNFLLAPIGVCYCREKLKKKKSVTPTRGKCSQENKPKSTSPPKWQGDMLDVADSHM